MKNKSDSFERKAVHTTKKKMNISIWKMSFIFQVDRFKIEAPDIGEIQKIRIGHNDEKTGSAWYLEKV